MIKEELKKIPGVDSILNFPKVNILVEKFGDELVKYSIRNVLNNLRQQISEGEKIPFQL